MSRLMHAEHAVHALHRRCWLAPSDTTPSPPAGTTCASSDRASDKLPSVINTISVHDRRGAVSVEFLGRCRRSHHSCTKALRIASGIDS